MIYDFDRVIDRASSDCSKWNVKAVFGKEDIIPMWVADMDFPVARPITEALLRRMQHEVYGYCYVRPTLQEAVVSRIWKRYGWKIEPEWIVFTPGVVPAINVAIRAFTHPGDEVIIQDPVYYPFWSAIEQNGRLVANNPLRLKNGHYEMDLDDLERKFLSRELMRRGPPRVKMMVLCNPHNPVGRVWSREELIGVGNVLMRHDTLVVSDEVHCELLFKGHRHTPFGSISKDFEQISIVCQGGSKTFNLAGIAASTIIIPNPKLRNAFAAERGGILPQPNVFALVALEAAYREGDDWLGQVLAYLQKNLDFMVQFVERRIPRLHVIKPEGTYLVWIDCRELGLDNMSLRAFFREKARVGLDDGYLFGPGGSGFQRMNIACPRSTLEMALKRIETAVNAL